MVSDIQVTQGGRRMAAVVLMHHYNQDDERGFPQQGATEGAGPKRAWQLLMGLLAPLLSIGRLRWVHVCNRVPAAPPSSMFNRKV
jgi:hypothetical protein